MGEEVEEPLLMMALDVKERARGSEKAHQISTPEKGGEKRWGRGGAGLRSIDLEGAGAEGK